MQWVPEIESHVCRVVLILIPGARGPWKGGHPVGFY